MKISLSVLSCDYADVKGSLSKTFDAVDYIHLDVMDGVFVNNISFGPAFIQSLRKLTDKPFDTHLMIQYPEKYIERFAEVGSQYITFHVEATCDVMNTINQIKKAGCKAGISIKPSTPVEDIKKYLPYLDMVLVMSVEPGFGSQPFMPVAIDKVKELKELKDRKNYNYLINIDGGINLKTMPLVKAYLDVAVSGSYICNSDNPVEAAKKLKEI